MAHEAPETKGLRPIDQIPYPRLYDPEAIALRLQRQLLEVVGGISVRRGASATEDRITIGDMKGAPPDLTYEKFTKYFSTQLGLDESELNSKNKTAVLLININSAIDAARRFIEQGIGLAIHPDALHAHVESLQDVYDLVKKTSQYSRTKGLTGPERLNRQASFCLLVLEALDALELQKKEFNELSVDGEKIRKMLVDSPESENNPFFYHVGNPTDEYTLVVQNSAIGKPPALTKPLSVRYRDKTFEAQMLKLGRKPEAQFNAREATRDEVGFEIMFPRPKAKEGTERDSKAIIQTMTDLISHEIETREIQDVQIENADFLNKTEFMQLMRFLSRRGLERGKQFSLGADTAKWLKEEGSGNRENPSSSQSFQNVKFTYSVKVPTASGGTRERNVEIQFADEISSVHDILADHRMYRVRQFVNFMTRRLGGCSEERILKMIDDALKEPGPKVRITSENVLKLLIENKYIVELPNISRRRVYADPTVFARQHGAGLYDGTAVPEEVRKIEHVINYRQRKK